METEMEMEMEMEKIAEEEEEDKEKQCCSYRYWVRNTKEAAAPLPVPRKLNPEDMDTQPPPSSLGSVWNKAGTWEEKNLNSWATARIKELLLTAVLEFSGGKAEITEVSNCAGDAFLITVRNKKRVGYTFELILKFKGEWFIQEEKKKINGYIDIPEFSFGELDDLQVNVRLSEEKDLVQRFKAQIKQDTNMFLHPIRDRLLQFEQELKER